MTKSLKEKAINIKGKEYVLVADRVLFFNENFLNGCIQTKLLKWEGDLIVVKAIVIPDTKEPERYFTGLAQEKIGDGYINKTSALENAETSAVGRALAMLGIGVIDSIASVDEIAKAENRAMPDPKKTATVKGTCNRCGADMIMSAKGKIYCSKKCWLNKGDGVSQPSTMRKQVSDETPPLDYDYKNDMPF